MTTREEAAALRNEARTLIGNTIDKALEERPALRHDIPGLIRLARRAYPFPERKHAAWDIWVSELGVARRRLSQQFKAAAS